MNKKGHLFITGHSLTYQYKTYYFWLMLGSILPDILVWTYLKGHTFEAMFEDTLEALERLQQKGKWNRRSCLRLGYALHYLEDYFTKPHNVIFTGNMKDHVLYEGQLTEYLYAHEKDIQESRASIPVGNSPRHAIQNAHCKYLLQNGGRAEDCEYIANVAKSVLECYADIFSYNEARALGETKRMRRLYNI